MNKIADADELEHELRQLLAYAQGERPSRSRLASALHSLSERVAAMSEDAMWNFCLWRANDKKIMPTGRGVTVMLKFNGTDLATKVETSTKKKSKPKIDYHFTAAGKKLCEESESDDGEADE